MVISLPAFAVELSGKTALPSRQTTSALKLHPGQVIEGRVLKPLSPGIFLVSVSGKHIRVASDIPLPRNALLSMVVSGEKGQAAFRLMEIQSPGAHLLNPAAIRGALAQNLWGNLVALLAGETDLPGNKSKLFSLLGQLSRITMAQPGAQGVKSFVQNAGLSWENKLFQALSTGKATPASMAKLMAGDLKGMLSKILADFNGSATALKGVYNALENTQLLNLHAGQEMGKLFVPMPLQFQDGTWGLAQILFFLPSYYEDDTSRQKNDSEKKATCSVTLVMTLSSLGTVQAELKLTGMTLQGKFQVDQRDTLEKIETQLPLLTQMLESRGIDVEGFTCQLSAASDLKTDLITEIISQEGSSVCFVA